MRELSNNELSQVKGSGPIGFLPFLEFAVICLKNGLTTIKYDGYSWICHD